MPPHPVQSRPLITIPCPTTILLRRYATRNEIKGMPFWAPSSCHSEWSEESHLFILSPGGRELEWGGFHPHLGPLPSRERKEIFAFWPVIFISYLRFLTLLWAYSRCHCEPRPGGAWQSLWLTLMCIGNYDTNSEWLPSTFSGCLVDK